MALVCFLVCFYLATFDMGYLMLDTHGTVTSPALVSAPLFLSKFCLTYHIPQLLLSHVAALAVHLLMTP